MKKYIFLSLLFCFGSSNAAFITNSDLVTGSPTLSLASGWNLATGAFHLPIDQAFDGDSSNPGNGRVRFLRGSDLGCRNMRFIVKTSLIFNTLRLASDKEPQ